jgi:hypothetical protein
MGLNSCSTTKNEVDAKSRRDAATREGRRSSYYAKIGWSVLAYFTSKLHPAQLRLYMFRAGSESSSLVALTVIYAKSRAAYQILVSAKLTVV